MVKRVLRSIRNHVILLITGTVLGVALLLTVYSLPTDIMREHVCQSLPMLEREFESENLIVEYPGTFMGAYTDCLMLENAVYESGEHSMLDQVLCMYRAESGMGAGWAPGYSLIDYLEGRPQPAEVTYSRYWHGYLVVLKPLLLVTSFTTIRLIASCTQLILLGGGNNLLQQEKGELFCRCSYPCFGSLSVLCQPVCISVS